MRRLTLALLVATYLCVALIVGLTLWRNGGGWGAGVAALVGTLGLAFAFHDLITRRVDAGELRAEIGAVREAHKILLGQVERLDGKLVEVARAVDADLRQQAALTTEVQMLEGLVEQMRVQLDDAISAPPPIVRPAFGQAPPPAQAPRRPTGLMETVKEALAENRVDLYLQPVLTLPLRRGVFYESFSRLRDPAGRLIMPAEYLSVAEPAGLVTAIDNLLLFRCVQIVRRLARQDRKVGIFCNISMASLADEAFFPQFLELLSANKDLAGALIFEVGQPAFDARGSLEARNMGKLAELGFRFSLDKVTDLDLDFLDLARSDVKFVKVGAQVLLEQLVEADGRLVLKALPDLAAEDFVHLLRRYNIELVAEKVESERQVIDILELNIGFGQGHLFGEPRAIKDAILAEASPPPLRSAATPLRRAYG
jgi:cyclic-di-GMP phosphodiesterase TipF (flagellum assembly factor)